MSIDDIVENANPQAERDPSFRWFWTVHNLMCRAKAAREPGFRWFWTVHNLMCRAIDCDLLIPRPIPDPATLNACARQVAASVLARLDPALGEEYLESLSDREWEDALEPFGNTGGTVQWHSFPELLLWIAQEYLVNLTTYSDGDHDAWCRAMDDFRAECFPRATDADEDLDDV
jgi:hypothetical protein